MVFFKLNSGWVDNAPDPAELALLPALTAKKGEMSRRGGSFMFVSGVGCVPGVFAWWNSLEVVHDLVSALLDGFFMLIWRQLLMAVGLDAVSLSALL